MTSPTRAIALASRAAAATAAPTPACGAARSLEVGANKHNGEVSDLSAIRESRNDVLFQTADARVLADEQVGGYGRDLIDQRDNQGDPRVAADRCGAGTRSRAASSGTAPTTSATRCTSTPRASRRWPTNTAAPASTPRRSPPVAGRALQFDVSTTSDFSGLMRTIDASGDRAALLHGVRRQPRRRHLSGRSWGQACVFNSAPTRSAASNYDRDFQSATGPQETFSKGLSFFVQDEVTFNRLTFNVGLRTERWEHFATTGANIYTFPWEFAPRISAAYDLLGNGRHKAVGVLRPVLRPRPQRHDQLRRHADRLDHRRAGLRDSARQVGDLPHARRPLRCRTRSSRRPRRRRTPTTSQFGYAVDLGNNMSFDALYYNRMSRDIMEDYDLELYADRARLPGSDQPPRLAVPRLRLLRLHREPRLQLRHRHARRRRAQLPGHGVRVPQAVREQLADAGVVHVAGCRGQHQLGWQRRLPGRRDLPRPARAESVRHPAGPDQATCSRAPAPTRSRSASSLAARSRGTRERWPAAPSSSSGRNLPLRVTAANAFEFAGFTARWLAPDSVGTLENPSWGQVDLRAQYNHRLMRRSVGRVLRRPLQHGELPGLDSQPGPRRRLRWQGLRRSDPVGQPAPCVPRHAG